MKTTCRSLVLALIVGEALSPTSTIAALRAIADTPSVTSYRMEGRLRAGGDPPLQLVEVQGDYAGDGYDVRVTLSEQGHDPVRVGVRRVDGKLYYRSEDRPWVEIEKYHLDELTVVTPDKLLPLGDRLEDLGVEELDGRAVRHLRGDKNDLGTIRGGSDSIDFTTMDSARLDLWADAEEDFIVKFEISALAMEHGETVPIEIVFEHVRINEPLTIEVPSGEELAELPPPPAGPSAEDVRAKLGFDFPLREGARAQIYGATVTIVTPQPLDEAREYADRTMRAAGYEPVEAKERAPGEHYTMWMKGEKPCGVLVFQVDPKYATIQVGAPK